MLSRRVRVVAVSVAALCAIGAALAFAIATASSSSTGRLVPKAAGDPDSSAATRFGNGNELREDLTPEDWAASIRAYPAGYLHPAWAQNEEATFNRLAEKTGQPAIKRVKRALSPTSRWSRTC
jgi:hypothetical protein